MTNTRITHATPAALYAHTNERKWECDSLIPEKYKDCAVDTARQLIEQEPGKHFKVAYLNVIQRNEILDKSFVRYRLSWEEAVK